MHKRVLTLGAALALVALTGCGSSASHAGQSATTALDPVTEDSTCVEWARATLAQQKEFARLAAPGIAIPAEHKEGEAADAYAFGLIAGRCHQAETTGTASQVTLGKLLAAPGPSSSTSEAPPSEDFLKPLPAVTIQNDEGARWRVVLNKSLVSATPLSGPGLFSIHDRLLEMQVSATYLTSGPTGDAAFVSSGLQLDEIPQDFGLSHVPVQTEDEEPEGSCFAAKLPNLCARAGPSERELTLYTNENEAPASAITTDYLNGVNPGEAESFWMVAHVPEHVNPTHVVLAWEDQPLSAVPER
jgi:hypothetical protein